MRFLSFLPYLILAAALCVGCGIVLAVAIAVQSAPGLLLSAILAGCCVAICGCVADHAENIFRAPRTRKKKYC